jgi:molybdopterin molybdotransferase
VPGKGEIRNSNAPQLHAQFQSVGISSHYQGIVSDTKDNVKEVLTESARKYNLTVLTGGVSMGDYDFVPGMMEKAGIEILFHKIAIKPGKPTILGRKGDHLVIGLPGNPVSTFLQFELLIKPVLFRMMGSEYKPLQWKLPLGTDIKSRKDDRESWKPVQILEGRIYPLEYHGSGHLHALHKTDGFIRIEAETERIKKNSLLNVRQI